MIKRFFRRKDSYERERDRSKQNQARLRGTWGYQILVFGSWTLFNIVVGLAVGALSKIIVYFFVVGKNFIFNLFQPNPNLQQFDQAYLNELIRQTLSGQTLLSEISLAVWIPATIVFVILERRTILDWWRMRQMYSPNTREKSRFATLEEIDRVYKAVPDRNKRFKGSPGQPISHINALTKDFFVLHPLLWFIQVLKTPFGLNNEEFPRYYVKIRSWLLSKSWAPEALKRQRAVKGGFKGFYFIDTKPTHAKTTADTRGGKDQTRGYPTIDINARAEKPWNIIDTDTKNEDSKMSYRALREAGFDVLLINIDDVDWSESFNPFQLALDYVMDGDTSSAINEVGKIVEIIAGGGARSETGDQIWNETAQATQKSIILFLLWLAREQDDPKLATPAGVPAFLNTMEKFKTDDNEGLSQFYDVLQQFDDHMAAQGQKDPLISESIMTAGAYRGARGDTRASIMFSLQNRIGLFSAEKIARLTSRSTINVLDVAYPRMAKLKFDPKIFAGTTGVFELYDESDYEVSLLKFLIHPLRSYKKVNHNKRKVIETDKLKISQAGSFEYPIESKLAEKWRIKVHFNDFTNHAYLHESYVEISGEKRLKKQIGGKIVTDKYSEEPEYKIVTHKSKIKKHLYNDGLKESSDVEFDLRYSEKPMAIFLITPQDNDEQATLASLFISQVFSSAASLATRLTRKKATMSILFKLNEFSMLPRIPGFDNLLTRGLTYGLMVDVYLQSMSQLHLHYSDEEVSEIDGNMMNWFYIQVPSAEGDKTNELLSSRIGNIEVVEESINSQIGNDRQDKGNRQMSVKEVPLMTEKELEELNVNEMIVIRIAARLDRRFNKIRPWPIFDTEKTAMPNTRDLMGKRYNLNYYTTDLGLKNKTADLEYRDLFPDYSKYFEYLVGLVNGVDQVDDTGVQISSLSDSEVDAVINQKVYIDDEAGQEKDAEDTALRNSENMAFLSWKEQFMHRMGEPFLNKEQLEQYPLVDSVENLMATIMKKIYYRDRSKEEDRVLQMLQDRIWFMRSPQENLNMKVLNIMRNSYESVWEVVKLIQKLDMSKPQSNQESDEEDQVLSIEEDDIPIESDSWYENESGIDTGLDINADVADSYFAEDFAVEDTDTNEEGGSLSGLLNR